MSLEGLPAAHLRVLLDGLPVFEHYGLVLAGDHAAVLADEDIEILDEITCGLSSYTQGLRRLADGGLY